MWSGLMLVTTAASQRSTARPRRRMPPRATSRTARSTSGWRSTVRAAPGPVQSPASIMRSSTDMPSVEVLPGTRPAVRAMRASTRAVVVLPLVPVISATGMRCELSQGTDATSGSWSIGQVRLWRPWPTETRSSSSSTGRPWPAALARRASSFGSRTRAMSSRHDASESAGSGCDSPPATRSAAETAQSLISVASSSASSGAANTRSAAGSPSTAT